MLILAVNMAYFCDAFVWLPIWLIYQGVFSLKISQTFIKFYFIVKHKQEVYQTMYTALPLPKHLPPFWSIFIDCDYIYYPKSAKLGEIKSERN